MSGGGDGPEDPMLEQRVARLESVVSEIKDLLQAQRQDITEIKIALGRIEGKFEKVSGQFEKVDGRFAGLDGRLSGLDARIAGLPSTWTMLGIVFTTWALGSGILIFAMNFLKR